MFRINQLLTILFCCYLFTSCEKEVNITLDSGAPTLVVNGQIETNTPPFVVLTRTIGYFSKVDLTTLQNSFVHDAIVKVSDGVREVRLKEVRIDTAGSGGPASFYFYTIDVTDPVSRNFLGEVGKSYKLVVEADGKTYTSTTKIPFPHGPDSIAAEAPAEVPSIAPTAMQLIVYYSDPDTPGNAIRYFTKRNDEPFYPGLNSVFDDAVINGAKNSRYLLRAGSENPSIEFSETLGYVYRGDTVTLKWAAIDRGVFNFYSTLEYSQRAVGNPFASPINVQTNVSNGALGIWAGYAPIYMTIVVPE